jgi:hypothetical protein
MAMITRDRLANAYHTTFSHFANNGGRGTCNKPQVHFLLDDEPIEDHRQQNVTPRVAGKRYGHCGTGNLRPPPFQPAPKFSHKLAFGSKAVCQPRGGQKLEAPEKMVEDCYAEAQPQMCDQIMSFRPDHEDAGTSRSMRSPACKSPCKNGEF